MSTNQTKSFATLFVAGNLLGVFPIAGQPGVYRPHELSDWTTSIITHPTAHMLSPLLFLIGALGGMALGWHCINHGKRWVGSLLLVGSGWNALFIPIPLILSQLTSSGHDIVGFERYCAFTCLVWRCYVQWTDGNWIGSTGKQFERIISKLGWSGIVIGIR